jgi:tryptophan-rich sensory protein
MPPEATVAAATPHEDPPMPLARSSAGQRLSVEPPLAARDVALSLAPLLAGSVVGVATNARGMGWYRSLSKPAWNPPDAVFGPVWTVLYLLMGIAASLVARSGRERRPEGVDEPRRRADRALGAFAVQLVLNLLWSVVFFGFRGIRPAAAEIVALWVAIVATIGAFARVRMLAAALLLPYLAWTTFAALLNLDIARRNPPR